MRNISLLAVLASALLAGCAVTAGTLPGPGDVAEPADRPTSAVPARDRQAILAMAGEFEVDFNFHETVALAEDYARREAKHSGAREVVLVIDDAGDHIVLQHLLIVGDGEVIKHWRQDWTWQARERLEFTDDQTWTLRTLEPDLTRGAWTQCVFGVADAPRYCGTGRWRHDYGHATWTSDRTWRPLPRREYTTREDYNALNVENRHTITPDGWTHEQDNSKVIRENGASRQVLVREFGFNDYRRTDDVDFAPAYEYWDATADYWARVRARWDQAFATGGVRLDTEVDGMPVIDGLFTLADRVREGESPDHGALEQVFRDYVVPAGDAGLATHAPGPGKPQG